jgi:hypothetical protein
MLRKAPLPALLMERATGIEPAFSAWEADVLPLNYAREQAREVTAASGAARVPAYDVSVAMAQRAATNPTIIMMTLRPTGGRTSWPLRC